MGKQKFWNYENKLVTIFFFAVGFVFFDRLAINFLIPYMQEDFSLTNTQIGILSSALAITWAISSPIVSFLSEKVKNKTTILFTFVLLFSLLSFAHGLTATFGALLVLRLLMGFAEGPIIPISSSILAQESSKKRLGFNLGLTTGTSYGVFGGLLAPLVIVALANAFDWKTAFYLTVVPGIIIAFVIWKNVKTPQTKQGEITSSIGKAEKLNLRAAIKTRNVWLCLVIACSLWVFLLPFSIFTPLYLMNVKGLSSSTMSLVMAAFGAGIALWGFVVPAISDRIGRKPTTFAFIILSIFAPFVVIYVNNVVLMSVLLFILVAGIGALAMLTTIIPSESVPTQYAAATMGLILAATEIVGGVLSPVITGMAADVWGLAAPLFISSCGAVVACIFSLFLKETAPVKVPVAHIAENSPLHDEVESIEKVMQ